MTGTALCRPTREVLSSRREGSAPACPACLAPLRADGEAPDFTCAACGRNFPSVAGLPDLRLQSDRYLSLRAERAKAGRLHALEPTTDLIGLASAYYDLTDDVVDHRRARFLRHIAGAEARGAALAERLPRGGHLLEVGCGSGGLLAAAAGLGLRIEGTDIASRWLVVARRRLTDRSLSVPLTVADAVQLPWADATFDAVVADSLLEHLDHPGSALREMARVLRPGGSLVLWSPNRFTLTTDPHLGLWGLGWLPRGALPHYLRLRGRDEWVPQTRDAFAARRLARRSGFTGVSVGPPPIPADWAATRRGLERLAVHAYSLARRLPVARTAVTAVGPLWELRATRGDGPC